MPKYKVIVTRRIPEAGLALLRGRSDVALTVYPKDRVIPRRQLLKSVQGAHAVLSLLTDKVDATLLDAAGPQLRVVSNYAVGYDNIDLAACRKRGIAVTNTPGVLSNAVAEHTFALMMAIARRIPESDAYIRSGKYKGWEPLLLIGSGVQGKTLGVIGLGRIGKGVVDRAARGMGMKIMYHDVKRDKAFEQAEPGTRYASVDRIVSDADFISIHVPLLPSTRHLIDARRLKMMKPTAYLINTSRGPIIDERALVAALKKGQIAGAALDVFEDEPRLTPGLAKLKNVVLTPHTASATKEARDDMATMAAQAILTVLDGKTPPNLVKT